MEEGKEDKDCKTARRRGEERKMQMCMRLGLLAIRSDSKTFETRMRDARTWVASA